MLGDHPVIERTERNGYANPEPVIVGVCEGCGQDIYEGEDVYDFSEGMIHQKASCCMEYVSGMSRYVVAGEN